MRMPYRSLMVCLLVGCGGWGLLFSAAPSVAEAAPADLGTIAFPTSGPPEAAELFERGVLYLHSFEYRDARAAFQAAQEKAPDFAMAYWGEAMTYNHPIWLEEDVESAREALGRLAPTPEARAAKTPTERERGYLRTVEILFGEGTKAERDQAYLEALEALSARYPKDHEAATFSSLAWMGICHEGREFPAYMRAAAIAQAVFAHNPRHPGAAHYLIHATDDPVHAPLGLRAAYAYAEIAPAAGHARHMPSHIFLALGMWAETVTSNQSSWDAVAARVKAEEWSVERNNYHALLWGHYGLLQQGRVQEAEAFLTRMAADHEESGSTRTGTHLALMRTAHAVGTGNFAGLPSAPEVGDGMGLAVAASIDLTAGLAALAKGEIAAAEGAAASIRARIASALEGERKRRDDSYARVGGVRTASAEVMALELEALIAEQREDLATALVKANEAADRERDTPSGFGPPVPAKPARELLGEILSRADRFDEAQPQLARALERTPRRAITLRALAQAARAAGDDTAADSALATLRDVWSAADEPVAEAVAKLQPRQADSPATTGRED